MSWITLEEMYPPQGLEVLLEVSGYYTGSVAMVADHTFYIGAWLVPQGKTEGEWIIYDNCGDDKAHIPYPTIHAWMPLPRHFQAEEIFNPKEDDLWEHPPFEKQPDWLYTGEYVYEQMSLEELMEGKE